MKFQTWFYLITQSQSLFVRVKSALNRRNCYNRNDLVLHVAALKQQRQPIQTFGNKPPKMDSSPNFSATC